MSVFPFDHYGFKTDNPPKLHTIWNEEKRSIDLNDRCYIFITSLYSSPWRQREHFPNTDRSTIFYYWSKYGDKRVKRSQHWSADTNSRWSTGITQSKVFNQSNAKGLKF